MFMTLADALIDAGKTLMVIGSSSLFILAFAFYTSRTNPITTLKIMMGKEI